MSHARSAVGDDPHYRDCSKLLAHDDGLAPFNNLDKITDEIFQPTVPAPLGMPPNLQVGSIATNVSGTWSHIEDRGLAVPAQSLCRVFIPPPSHSASDIQHTETEHSSPFAIRRAGDILTHPSIARTFQIFRTGFSRGFTRAVKLPAALSPIARPSKKRPRTPYPVKADDHLNIPGSDTNGLSPKRLRGLPKVDIPSSTKHAAGSGKVDIQVQGGQANLRYFVRWLTGYMYFLISNQDRASSSPAR
jgi:hypothetical protein